LQCPVLQQSGPSFQVPVDNTIHNIHTIHNTHVLPKNITGHTPKQHKKMALASGKRNTREVDIICSGAPAKTARNIATWGTT